MVALLLLFLPSCFLPGWQERPWVDDDDTADDDTGTTDDDVTDDDDDTAPTEIDLTGEADIYLSYQTMGEACIAPLAGEMNAERTKIDGDGECTVFGYVADVELDCDVAGTTVDGTLLVYNEMLPMPLTIPMDGSYNEGTGAVSASGSTSFYGISGNASVTLQPVE